jgi:two-component system cell cycle sensor histidine kinase/response regulator CckA
MEENKRILVVDTDKAYRKLACRYLAEDGFEVAESESGKKAVDLSTYMCFDLLITDALLPHINGRDLAAKVSIYQPNIKVLFASGYDFETLCFHKLCPAGGAYVKKPFGRNELIVKVDSVLSGGRCWKDLIAMPEAARSSGIWDKKFLRNYFSRQNGQEG